MGIAARSGVSWTKYILKTQTNIIWYILTSFAMLIMIFERVHCSDWDGCVGSNLMIRDLCYKIQPPMSGEEAWKNCTTMKLSDVYTNYAEPLREMLLTRGGGQPMWVGSIQPYPGAKMYENYYKNFDTGQAQPQDGTQGCLALEASDPSFIKRRSCDEKLHVICIVHKRITTKMFNASAPESCNDTRAVSMSIIPGCFTPSQHSCPGYFVRVRPLLILYYNESWKGPDVEMYKPIGMYIIELNTNQGRFRKENETDEKSTLYCLKERETTHNLQLQLRQNVTAGEPTLWVSGPGRMAKWPPKCVGGHVNVLRPRGNAPHLLRVIRNKREQEIPVVWCYALDIITGGIAVSNRILFLSNETSNSCPDSSSGSGPPPATTVNHKASCLHCLEKVIRSGDEGEEKGRKCTEMRCGPFNLKYTDWKTIHHNTSFTEFKRCAESRQCAGDVLWDLTERKGYKKGGVVDCDDLFSRFILFSRPGSDANPRNNVESQIYWECRTQRNADFVDVSTINGTARYYCWNDLFKGRHWSKPEYISPEDSYGFITERAETEITTEPAKRVITREPAETVITTEPAETEIPKLEREIIEDLSTFQHITVDLPRNKTLTINQTQEIIQKFSRIFNVSDESLRKAQRAINITSLPELLESILIRAPDNVNFTMPNLAVTKKQSIGFQLISDEPLTSSERFGDNPKQMPISRRDDIIRSKAEAAVVFSNISRDITMVMVTFAKGHDFIPGQKHISGSRAHNVTVKANGTSVEKDHSPKTVKPEEKCESGEKCRNRKIISRGCINTHVIQVALLNKSGSYVPLPKGDTVDVIFRTKVQPMIGQIKYCAYWIPEIGEWSPDGCELIEANDGLDTCRCSHLTHFAQLVTEGGAVYGPHESILTMFTICSCGVSLLGLAGVIATGVFIKKWRRKNENKVLTNLAVAQALYMGLFLKSALLPNPLPLTDRCTEPEDPNTVCQVTGAALHYFLLCSFCWMLVAAITHCLRLTTFMGTSTVSHFVLKTSLVGWGLPLVPVAVLMSFNAKTYNGRGRDFCYPTGYAFYGAVLGPILLVLLINMAIFLFILKTLFPYCCTTNKSHLHNHMSGKNDFKIYIRKLVVCVAFTFLFGLTWYLGLMSYTVISAYVLCIVMGLQGPALLVFFVLGEETIRNKLKNMTGKIWNSESKWSGSTSSTAVFALSSPPRNRWESPSRMNQMRKRDDDVNRELSCTDAEMRSDLW